MKLLRWQAILGLAAALVAVNHACAQKKLSVGFVYPGGGQPGTTFEVLVGGQFLKNVTQAHISGGGVKATVVEHDKLMTQGEMMRLRDKLLEARKRLEEKRKGGKGEGKQGGKGYSPSGRLTREEIARAAGISEEQLVALDLYHKNFNDPKRQLNPQLEETIRLQIELAKEAKPGERELRLLDPAGMANPLSFYVGQFPECYETEPNDATPDSAAITGPLPMVVNGQILPGDVDLFTFKAHKGERLVAEGSMRALVPYLADAVPGWFQGVLALYDANGDEVAYAGALGFRQDPVLYYEVPEDGEYVLEVRDSIYRGREDFVYRVVLGEVPLVTAVFPLGGRAGTHVDVALKGWNLPVDKLNFDAYYDRRHPIRSISVRRDGVISNEMPFAVDGLTESFEQEPNDTQEEAIAVKLPIIVNGYMNQRGDRDVFSFEAHGRETVVVEVYARRLGSPMDSYLKITDAAGKIVAISDDYEDKGIALATHHADSRIAMQLPGSGTYYVHLRDAQSQSGPDCAYRLHIRPPRPDFELRVVPSSLSAPAGTSVPIEVFLIPRDGFSDDVVLRLLDPPAGFKLDGGWVPAPLQRIDLTLTVSPEGFDEPVTLEMEGIAQVGRRKRIHLAVPTEHVMQAFLYTHLVPARSWTVAITKRRGLPRLEFALKAPAKLPAGGTVQVRAAATRKYSFGDLVFDLVAPPKGITIDQAGPDEQGVVFQLRADAEVKPGLRGNLIFRAFREYNGRRSPQGTLPAMPFEVVAAKKAKKAETAKKAEKAKK